MGRPESTRRWLLVALIVSCAIHVALCNKQKVHTKHHNANKSSASAVTAKNAKDVLIQGGQGSTTSLGVQRKYVTKKGFKNYKKYLSRKFQESHKNDSIATATKRVFTNTWAVKLQKPENSSESHDAIADRIATKHGFNNLNKIGNLDAHYHFKHDDVGESEDSMAKEKTDLLELEEEVEHAVQQVVLTRYKRDGAIPNDPYFKDMWYLLNTGQASGPAGVDMNVLPVWNRNITGSGIVVAVLDDGLDWTHPDLEKNYDSAASYDFNDNDADPMPRDSDADNCHGTRCAGEAAAIANNGICGTGVSYNAKIGGVRMLDGQATDALEASALGHKSDHIDIYINCWGPKDDGKTFGKPGPMAAKALRTGAEQGRNNLGSIFVWATGNGGLTDDDCNCDGYTTSIFTISIGCIGDHGLSAYYTEKCSSTLAVTFNGASHKEGRENKMVTTDLYHQCTEEFKGTSASAPLAAGIIALTLEANPNLTWRDVQALIVNTAQITSPVDDGWKRNGAGYHYNHKFGFGRLDADAMVTAAKTWKTLGPQRKCTAASGFDHQDIPRGDSLFINVPTVACESSSAQIAKLEHVVVTVSFVHRRRGDVSIDLISPGGTRSQMLSPRRYDDSDEGLDEWNFMTVYNWGENPKGMWRLKITDNPNQDDTSPYLNGEENDVEELEEQVIDAQAKMNKAKWDEKRKKDPFFDEPYPAGVKKANVLHVEPSAELKARVDSLRETGSPGGFVSETDRIEYDRSGIQHPSSADGEEPHPSYNQYIVPVKKGNLAVFDEQTPEGEGNQADELPAQEIAGKRSEFPEMEEEEGDADQDSEDDEDDEDDGQRIRKKAALPRKHREKKDLFDEEKREIFNYYNNIRKKTSVFGRQTKQNTKSNNFKKVQVQEEETGTQRVQVNAGYENPRIACESGYNSCSGVLLKWVLTLYGTGA